MCRRQVLQVLQVLLTRRRRFPPPSSNGKLELLRVQPLPQHEQWLPLLVLRQAEPLRQPGSTENACTPSATAS